MLQIDSAARRRFTVILIVFGTLLGGLMLSGLAQRLNRDGFEANGAETTVEEAREEVRKTRQARAVLEKLGKQEKWNEAVTFAEEQLKEADRPLIRFLRNEALIRLGRFPETVSDFDKTLRGGDPTIEAARLTFIGDKAGYQKLCERLLKVISTDNADASLANNTAWLCALMPGGMPDYTQAIVLARFAVNTTEVREDLWTFQNTLGVLYYRAGQYTEAVTYLREAEKRHPDAFNWPFLALAYHRLGDAKQATYWRNRYRNRLTTTYATNVLAESRHELLLFYQELENEKGFTQQADSNPG